MFFVASRAQIDEKVNSTASKTKTTVDDDCFNHEEGASCYGIFALSSPFGPQSEAEQQRYRPTQICILA